MDLPLHEYQDKCVSSLHRQEWIQQRPFLYKNASRKCVKNSNFFFKFLVPFCFFLLFLFVCFVLFVLFLFVLFVCIVCFVCFVCFVLFVLFVCFVCLFVFACVCLCFVCLFCFVKLSHLFFFSLHLFLKIINFFLRNVYIADLVVERFCSGLK